MRIWIFSDLHIESCAWDLPRDAPVHDVIVAAGDILTPCSEAVRWLGARGGGRPVIHVPGNHEWYGHPHRFSVSGEREKARALAREAQVTYLEDDLAIIGGVRFLGATLWTDYDLHGTPSDSMTSAALAMNDHRLIQPEPGGDPLTPAMALAWHKRSRAWLEARLREPFNGPTVVVTHHAPHRGSVAPRFADDPLTPAFCSNLTSLVERGGAVLWIHGHTHDSFDYVAGGARVVCNPKGYGPRTRDGLIENARFDPHFVVEL